MIMDFNKIYQGDTIEVLKTFDDKSINCVVTSPPYWGLRDYGTAIWEGGDPNCDHKAKASLDINTGAKKQREKLDYEFFKDVCKKCGAKRIDKQIGLEITPEEYIRKLVDIFKEIKRKLKDDGTVWLNLGDSYAGSNGAHQEHHKNPGISNSFKRDGVFDFGRQGKTSTISKVDRGRATGHHNLKSKDLVGIPWMVALALRADGWYLRQDIIWHKPNPMPESVKDRCTKAHEYIFLLTKSAKYYFNPILEIATGYDGRKDTQMKGSKKYSNGFYPTNVKTQSIALKGHERWPNKIRGYKTKDQIENLQHHGKDISTYPARNKRSVWTVNTKPFSEAHFAVFPEELIIPCIKAGCPENGVVLDPFIGSGTVAMVALKLNRNYIGIELNSKYIDMANKRIRETEIEVSPVKGMKKWYNIIPYKNE